MQNKQEKLLFNTITIKAKVMLDNPEILRRAGLYALYVALLIRVIWALLVPVVAISDSYAYDVFAQNIASGGGFGWNPGQYTAYWAVGTSAVYALLYTLFGHSYFPIVILNLLIGVTTVALAMSLAQRWLGQVPAVLTGWILAFWPLLIEYTTVLASELLFNFCVLTVLWLASMPNWKILPRTLVTGLALAAACYVRPIALLAAPLAFLREAFIERRMKRAMLACVGASLVMIILILPWSFRNLRVFNHFVLVSTNAGANFWMGNNPDTKGTYMALPNLPLTNEAELDQELNRQAWAYIRIEPFLFVQRTFKKALTLHDRESIGVMWNELGLQQNFGQRVLLPLKILSSGYWYCVLLGACIGVIFLFKNKNCLDVMTLPPLTFWLYFTAIHSISVSGDRYHIPSLPFVAMLTAYGISEILNIFNVRKIRHKNI